MGRSDSKYSKKKKVSSEGRRKKNSKSNKSKKIRHRDRDDSFSSCSDDDSTTSLSLTSSSSSEEEYNRKRSRSRARNEVKSSKKRSRKRSLSEESSEDSPPVKKKKRSKKKFDSETRKKNKKDKKIKKKKKKKSRKYAYSSSTSDSESCSTCNDEDSNSDEGVSHRTSRGRNENRKSRSKTRTRSISPSKSSDSYDDENTEKMTVGNNSRRLKSVITVVKPPENEEEHDMKTDELKEEIVYDYDDYPSSKSNDSNDGERTVLPSVIAEVNSNSSLNDSKEKEVKNASGNIGSAVGDLESVLRQKALENLSKFRGGIQTKSVVSVDNKNVSEEAVKKTVNHAQNQDGFSISPVSQPVIPRSRFTWRRDPSVTVQKESGPHTHGTQTATPKVNMRREENKVVNETMKIVDDMNNVSDVGTGVDQKSTTVLETQKVKSADVSSTSSGKNKILNERMKIVADIGADVDQKSTAALESVKSADISSMSRVGNKIVNEPTGIMVDIGTDVDQKSSTALEKLKVKSANISSRVENKVVNETLKIGSDANNKSIGDIGTDVDQKSTTVLETPSSASTKEGGSSKDQVTETNDNSQFEQKTMSVMRGGEMVQVSYKVYIPTRAPAMARRKLKR